MPLGAQRRGFRLVGLVAFGLRDGRSDCKNLAVSREKSRRRSIYEGREK